MPDQDLPGAPAPNAGAPIAGPVAPTPAWADPRPHWLLAQVRVRCGLAADGPACVRDYLHWGAEVAVRSGMAAFKVQLRILRTLLLAAQDEALPAPWRHLCLSHAHLPLAELASSIGVHDPIAMQALEAAVGRARRRWPSAGAAPAPGRSSCG